MEEHEYKFYVWYVNNNLYPIKTYLYQKKERRYWPNKWDHATHLILIPHVDHIRFSNLMVILKVC